MKQSLLNHTSHRNVPLPEGPWMMYQQWRDILSLHVPVDPEALAPYVPDALEIDLYDGMAWLSIFPFEVNGLQLRGLPRFPGIHRFLELNVRTYVRYKGTPGVYFFSLDAEKLLPVIGARMGTLPYYKASMKSSLSGGWTYFSSERWCSTPVYFEGKYKTVSEHRIPESGSIDAWLLERYYLFNTVGREVLQIGIHHRPWKLAEASAVYDPKAINSLLPGDLEGAPAFGLHMDVLDVLFWPPQRV